MLRRSSIQLLRRSEPRLSGGGLYHPPTLEQVPSADTTKGFFGAYKNGAALARLIDVKWMMTRCVETGRDHYIAAPTMALFLWMYCWKGVQFLIYKKGSPPRDVDWNTEEAGYLPHGFEPTKITHRV